MFSGWAIVICIGIFIDINFGFGKKHPKEEIQHQAGDDGLGDDHEQ